MPRRKRKRPLQALHQKHKGEPCVLLANGSTLNNADMSLIPKGVATIGMNASWTLHWPTYHVCGTRKQAEWSPEAADVFQRLADQGRLFTFGAWSLPGAWAMPRMSRATRRGRQTALSFSADISEGVQDGVGGLGSVAYVALQVAVSLGFTTMFWVGLDLGLGGVHHHGHWPADESRMKRQNTSLAHAEEIYLEPHGIKSYVVGSPRSNCTVWPKISFPEMLKMLEAK